MLRGRCNGGGSGGGTGGGSGGGSGGGTGGSTTCAADQVEFILMIFKYGSSTLKPGF